jgi:hypothetical protein
MSSTPRGRNPVQSRSMPPPVITYGDWVASWTMQTHLRVIVALSLSWLGALLALCHRVNGGAKGFSREGEPGTAAPLARLLAMGGLYGQQRPYLEVAGVTACAGVLGMVALACCDFVYARHTKARWFALHVIANVWISLLCLPDLAFMAADPLAALKEHRLNHWPASLIFSVRRALASSSLAAVQDHVHTHTPSPGARLPHGLLQEPAADRLASSAPLRAGQQARSGPKPSPAPPRRLHHLLMVVLAGPIVITAEAAPAVGAPPQEPGPRPDAPRVRLARRSVR